MVKRMIAIGLCLVLGVALAESPRKSQGTKTVDLDAAAKATASLYANLPAPVQTHAQTQVAAPVARSKVVTPPAAALPQIKPSAELQRPSPLLPAVMAEPAPTAALASAEVWQGAYQCAHTEKVHLRPDAAPDQVALQWKGQQWSMRRIDSQSGAMRLEDAQARMVWIQLPNKSMLLDQRQGKRLLDDCQHAVQVQTAAQMKNNPPPALFDTTGMGR